MTSPLLVSIVDCHHQLMEADLLFMREECHCQLFHYDDYDALLGERSDSKGHAFVVGDASDADDFDSFDVSSDALEEKMPQADIVLLCLLPGEAADCLSLVSVIKQQLAAPSAPFLLFSKDLSDDPRLIYGATKGLDAAVLPISSSHYLKNTFFAVASIAREKLKAKLRADEASKVAFSSMAANSQLGETIRFFERSYAAANFDELCSLYLETISNIGLQGAILISVDGQSFYKTNGIESGEIERGLSSHKSVNRFDQESFGLVVTFGRVRSVIVDMPPLEDEAHGRLRDVLATLIEGMNFCVQSLAAQIASVMAERTKSLMLSTLSHELRTPMNAIVGFCSILSRKEEGDVMQPRDVLGLQEVKENALRLKDIIDDLLSLGDIDEGMIFEERLVLPDLLREVFERTTREAAKKSVAFLVAPDIEPELMKSDGKRVVQIVKNLLSNAVKFTFAGKIFYFQSLKKIKDRNFIEIVIADTGIGIEESNMERIFEPFVQLDMETTRAHEGAGIGLSVAKHMVEQLQGWIELNSTPGKGSEFRVYLPTGR